MIKTKNLIILLLVSALACSLTGCNSTYQKDKKTSAEATEAPEESAVESAEEPKEDTVEELAEPETDIEEDVDEPDPEPEDVAEEPVEEEHEFSSMEAENAYRQAQSYLEFSAFSKQGLIDQLTSEYGSGYKKKAAKEAVEYLEESGEVDWYDEAYRSAKDYLDSSPFSKKGLIAQLSSKYGGQFTEKQATKAVNKLEKNKEVDWKEQAVQAAKDYLDFSAFSRNELISQLSSEYGSQFTKEEATYAADKVGL